MLTDAEACSKSIEAIEKSFRSSVETAVNKRLAASAGNPAGNSGGSADESMVANLLKMQTVVQKQTMIPFGNKK